MSDRLAEIAARAEAAERLTRGRDGARNMATPFDAIAALLGPTADVPDLVAALREVRSLVEQYVDDGAMRGGMAARILKATELSGESP